MSQRLEQFSSEISQVLICMTPKYLAAKWEAQSITQLFCLCVSPQSPGRLRGRLQIRQLVPGEAIRVGSFSPVTHVLCTYFPSSLHRAGLAWSSLSSHLNRQLLKEDKSETLWGAILCIFLLFWDWGQYSQLLRKTVFKKATSNSTKVIHYHNLKP